MENKSQEKILQQLIECEHFFHQPSFETNFAKLENWFDIDFIEVGASGQCYKREEVINILFERIENAIQNKWKSENFHCLEIAKNCYLLTYTLIQGERITHRASIWRHVDNGWKIVYHQGTLIKK